MLELDLEERLAARSLVALAALALTPAACFRRVSSFENCYESYHTKTSNNYTQA